MAFQLSSALATIRSFSVRAPECFLVQDKSTLPDLKTCRAAHLPLLKYTECLEYKVMVKSEGIATSLNQSLDMNIIRHIDQVMCFNATHCIWPQCHEGTHHVIWIIQTTISLLTAIICMSIFIDKFTTSFNGISIVQTS